MITKRIIPCLDVRDGRVVKGQNFVGIKDVENPVTLAKFYNEQGADELVFYDITASFEGRKLFTDILTEVAKCVFIPLTVGGGINTVEDFDRVLKCGADKVSVNSGAIKNPALINQAAKKYGDQCVVLSMDVKRVDGKFTVFAKGGRENTGLDAIEWAKFGVENGAGEIVLNSIDTDGVKNGFDIEMLNAICSVVNVPVIASGGAGKKEDFKELFENTNASAGLAASIFHFGEVKIPSLKEYLKNENIEMRII
ncbi:MAG: imidazole glycerol phosphate synthase subunit HisF [Clostridiales bacterium]|nr:imidazole glycerol phosphate synthase subunit HisF [Clostridia bacterium]MCR4563475.1 imidazole glycerol phosphate synthase subunit HisF [Clostridiales bacterium]